MPPCSSGTNTSWTPSSSPHMRRTSASGNSSRSSSSMSSSSGSSRCANSRDRLKRELQALDVEPGRGRRCGHDDDDLPRSPLPRAENDGDLPCCGAHQDRPEGRVRGTTRRSDATREDRRPIVPRRGAAVVRATRPGPPARAGLRSGSDLDAVSVDRAATPRPSARPTPVSAGGQTVLPVGLDEASVGQRRADGELAADEGRRHDLGELPRLAVAAAAEQGEAFTLGRQLRAAADRSDDEVGQPARRRRDRRRRPPRSPGTRCSR